jgi:t-SNARE complex subunit (syntaxin)
VKRLREIWDEAIDDAKLTLHEATLKGRRSEHYHIRRAARRDIQAFIVRVVIVIGVVVFAVVYLFGSGR